MFRLSLFTALSAMAVGCALAQEVPQGQRETSLGGVESFEFSSSELDRVERVMTFQGFRITGENWNLTADHATAKSNALDFEAGQLQFSGNIQLQLDTAWLQADTAVFDFRARGIVMAELSGNPMTFEDQATADHDAVHGSAMTLRYDDDAGSFQLLGSVTLTVGPYRTTGCDLIYYLGQEEFTTGSTQCDEPFVTTIVSQESEQAPVD